MTREEIFKVHTKGMPLKEVDLKDLAAKTDGYVGADIEAVCREAAVLSLREDINSKNVKMEHFRKAIDKVRPSASKDIEKEYSELKDQFSSARAKEMSKQKPSYFGWDLDGIL